MDTTAWKPGFSIAKCFAAAALLLTASALLALQATSPPVPIADPLATTPGGDRTGNESLSSDRVAYRPGTTVHLSGEGYPAFRDLTLRVTGPDGSSTQSPVSTDANGRFAAAYDPIAEGSYSVEVIDGGGASLAVTAFSASSSSCPRLGTERLDANKVFYDDGETVHFTGSGYAPACSFTLRVAKAGSPPSSTATVTSDAAGSFAYDSLLPSGEPALYLASVANDGGTQLAIVALAVNSTCNMTVGNPGTFATIQQAVDALPNTGPGPCTITVSAGTYNESVEVGTSAAGKNTLATNDSQRYLIQADPSAAPGSVVVNAAGDLYTFRFMKSEFITLKGFALTGTTSSGGSAVLLLAGGNSNNDITIEGNLIYENAGGNTGTNSSDGGILLSTGTGNSQTWIVNNLIRNNSRNGVFVGSGPAYVVNNTLFQNGFNGVAVGSGPQIHVVNNLIVDNGTAAGATGGRVGLNCVSCAAAGATNRFVQFNVFYRNRLGDLNSTSDWLDATTDAGNRTPFSSWSTNGTSGSGNVVGWLGCTFSDCSPSHANTEIFEDLTTFHLRTTPPPSPAIDKGRSSYIHGGLEWVPGVANARAFAPKGDGADSPPTSRPQSVSVDAGYDEAVLSTCGNGTTEGTEQCDQGAANGTSSSCCSASCTFKLATETCRAGNGVCDPAELCTGASATCPGDVFAPDNTLCADTDLCDGTETCQSGVCTSPGPTTCDDGNPCTTDTCTPATGCVFTPNPANSCSDGNACNGMETCNAAGTCVGGTPVVCTGDQCNDPGTCDTTTGICSPPTPKSGVVACDDGFFCTVADTCAAGVCVGSARDCSGFGNTCNTGVCNEATDTCVAQPVTDGTACSDNDACTQTDTCQGGTCTGSNPVTCTALDQCHDAGVCNPSTGICSNPAKPDGSSCSDGNACTTGDACTTGLCVGGPPPDCDDSNTCTVDTCNPAAGCLHAEDPASCEPATLTLSPATATNVVGTTHCVTATVRDPFGVPTPGVTVRFSVTPATFPSPSSGSAATNGSGEATFCYSAALPGEDVIHAYADDDNDNTQDLGEPFGDASKTWTPPPSTAFCEVKVTEGGWIIASNGDRASFGGNAKVDGDGNVQGEENYQDHGPAQPTHVRSTEVLAVTCSDDLTMASIFGIATVDDVGTFVFRIDVSDQGEPGTADSYGIMVSNGYVSGQHLLQGGNVQIHKN